MLFFTGNLLLSSFYELGTLLSTRNLAANRKVSALETLYSTSEESSWGRLKGLLVGTNWEKYGCPYRCEEEWDFGPYVVFGEG